MAISTACLCTREDVKHALDIKETARSDGQIDRALEAATRAVEGLLHRRFHPTLTTRRFDRPSENARGTRPWRLWLDANELISITTLTSGGVAIVPADYILRRSDGREEPPYTHVELDRSSSSAFGGGSTPQQDIAITGVFGYSASTAPAGALAEALDASEAAVDVTNSAAAGVGDSILVGTERMLVTGKTMLSTGQTLQANMTASAADVTAAVTTGSAYTVGEVLLLDSERMLIVDAAGNNLTVKRAWDGTVLAAHSGSTIYAPRTLTVVRAALGTTAATHDAATAVSRHVVPPLVRDLAVAEAIAQLQQESSAYARTIGSEDNQREVGGRGLKQIRELTYAAYGRKARNRAV